MTPMLLVSLSIPAAVAVGLVALMIKERYHFLPKRNKVKSTERAYESRRKDDDYHNNLMDLSGEMMGI